VNTNGQLTFINSQDSGGIGPAYVNFGRNGTFALVANYGPSDTTSTNATISVLPITDSHLLPTTQIIFHYGNGTNPSRQLGTHPHAHLTDSNGIYTFVPNLGLDKIFQYILNSNGTLSNNTMSYASSSIGGSGPRHMCWHISNQFAYVVNEVINSIDVFNYSNITGLLTGPFQTISTIPDNFTNFTKAAEIAVTPDGRFLYASNRGFDSIVSYKIDIESKSEHLTLIEWITEGVTFPWSFAIDPMGKFLLVGSSTAQEIVTFSINSTNGRLTPTGAVISTDTNMCIQIMEFRD